MSRFGKDETAVIVGTYAASAEAGDDYAERNEVLKEIALDNKVSDNVIRGVLVAEGVYVKKEVSGAGSQNKRVDKEALAKSFEAAFGMKLKSIRNMTGKDLDAFWTKFVEMSDIRAAG